MDPDIPDHARYRLQSYERSITAVDQYFEDPENTGRFNASDIYREKALAASCLERLRDNEGPRPDVFDEFDRLNRKLAELEQRKGQDLKDRLLGELRYYLDSYSAGICFMCTRTMGPEDVADVAPRNVIGILVEKLQSDFDLADLKQILRELDNVYLSMKENAGGIHEKSPTAGSSCNPDPCHYPIEETVREE